MIERDGDTGPPRIRGCAVLECRFVMLTATGRFVTDRFVMLTIVLECRFVMLTAVGRFVMLTTVLFQCSVFRCSVFQELHFVLVIVVIGL